MKPPPGFAYRSESFKTYLESLDPHSREQASKAWHQQADHFRRFINEPPVTIGNSVQMIAQEEIDAGKKRQRKVAKMVSCKAGCSHCCKTHVSLVDGEAQLMRKAAEESGYPIDEARLDRQAGHDHTNWQELAPADRRCVFLNDEDECDIYVHRPIACRKYHVVSKPHLCDMIKYPGGQVKVWIVPRAEMVDSAAATVFGYDSMAEALIKARSDDADQLQDQQDHQDGDQGASGAVAPAGAMGPGGDRADQQQHQDDHQDQAQRHGSTP